MSEQEDFIAACRRVQALPPYTVYPYIAFMLDRMMRVEPTPRKFTIMCTPEWLDALDEVFKTEPMERPDPNDLISFTNVFERWIQTTNIDTIFKGRSNLSWVIWQLPRGHPLRLRRARELSNK